MNLVFSEMAVDTRLAQEYMEKNETLLKLYNDYNGTMNNYYYAKNEFGRYSEGHNRSMTIRTTWHKDHEKILLNLVQSFKQNATLIAQLEYYIRNIPIEDTKEQLNLIIQYIRCHAGAEIPCSSNTFHPNDPLLMFGSLIGRLSQGGYLASRSKATAPICHLIVTLVREAGAEGIVLNFDSEESDKSTPLSTARLEQRPVKGLDSGTVAVVSDDADVDSAVDKFISVSKQAPWRLRRILVQESVYQRFKDALTWKCNLNQSGSGSKPLSSDALCSDTLTYNGRTFLIDPVEVTEEKPSAVTVEAYRTTKEMISLVQQDKPRYLSLWTNGIAEINEVTSGTKSPVVWVNNVADFRGPPQVAEAVFSYFDTYYHTITDQDKVARLCKLSQSWLKLDLESRRDIICGALDKYILLDPANKVYTDIRNYLSAFTLNSFVDVGKDYVCTVMLQPIGIMGTMEPGEIFSVDCFKSILLGNALLVYQYETFSLEPSSDFAILEEAGVPVVQYTGDVIDEDLSYRVLFWLSGFDNPTRVIWTNSGTMIAN